MRANLQRAPTLMDDIDGVHYRIGLVLRDAIYRDELLALPRLDDELVDLFRLEGGKAQNATVASQRAWDALAVGFDNDIDEDIVVPDRPLDVELPEAALTELGAHDWRAKQEGCRSRGAVQRDLAGNANRLTCTRRH